MKLFCRQDHRPKERDLQQELLEARAELARLRKLPVSNWTPVFYHGNYQIREHSVDRKAAAIAYKEAEVAELEVLTGLTCERTAAKPRTSPRQS